MKKALFCGISNIRVLRDEPMSNHTTFHIGGKADYFLRVFSKKSLLNVLKIIKIEGLKYYLVGIGSNLLVSDKGLRGVVIKLEGNFRKIYANKDRFNCGSGVELQKLTYDASRLGYGGIEFLAGIPGTVGGAVMGNAGSLGHSIADVLEEIKVINRERILKKEEVGFSYRGSKIKDGTIITAAVFRLKREKESEIRRIIKKNLNYRHQRQPNRPSCGSFFKNPPGLSAGRLIDECGLKGLRIGDAEVSRKHGNFIVNCGGAKASDVIRLAHRIKRMVKEKKGITLTEEVKILR